MKWFPGNFSLINLLQIVEGDPRAEPVSDDEGETSSHSSVALRASKLLKAVRRRKGLHTEEQVVVHAEKQRTLNKKKWGDVIFIYLGILSYFLLSLNFFPGICLENPIVSYGFLGVPKFAFWDKTERSLEFSFSFRSFFTIRCREKVEKQSLPSGFVIMSV